MKLPTTRCARFAAIAIATVAIGCTPDGTVAPDAVVPNVPARALTLAEGVITVQLRALPPNPIIPTDPLYGYGHLQLRLGSIVDNSCLPPSPITPQPGYSLLTVCGRIFNEGGARFTGGGIYTAPVNLGDGYILQAAFNTSAPLVPCRRYDIAGVAAISTELATAIVGNPTGYQVLMDGDVAGQTTSIGGVLDGSAWGPVGTRPETDPYFAEKVCTVTVAP